MGQGTADAEIKVPLCHENPELSKARSIRPTGSQNIAFYFQLINSNSAFLSASTPDSFYFQFSSVQFGSIQFIPLTDRIGSSGGREGRFSRNPLPVFSAGGPCGQFWLGQGCPYLRCCPSSISSADHDDANAPRRLEGRFWRDRSGVFSDFMFAQICYRSNPCDERR